MQLLLSFEGYRIKAWAKFCRTFISNISLLLDLREALLVKQFPYNHSISDVSAGLNNTRQRDFVKVKAKIINFR